MNRVFPMVDLSNLLLSDSAVTALEYALIGSLVSAVVIVAIGALGDKVSALYTTIVTAFLS